MPQTPEAEAFLARIAKLPPAPAATDVLSQALQPSIDDEAELRKLWATDKTNARLRDPHVGLVDVFDAPDDIRKTRPRVVTDEADLNAHHILPLSEDRRRKEGEPSMVANLDEFKKNWAIFTEGSLSQLTDWSNVVAAGGSVQACLAPVPESAKVSKRAMRKHFHNSAFPTSDVDLFLYGLTPAQAEAKMQAIYEAVRDSVPWDVTCVRTRRTVSIHSQYPYRSVQIVLRLYSSPAEILAGFDVDAPCCAFNGARVWASPRAIVAMMRQANTVDMTRRSPSYEVRLAKYSMRGFEVYVPALKREDIDPTIFERSIQRVQGLARLLVLERLVDADTRQRYLIDRRKLRTRPDAEIDYSRRKKKLKGDLKANIDIGGIEMNDYDVQSLHIPYGPGWDARRIDKLVYQTDLGMNSPYNPKNKDRHLHRHPAFFGTLKECIEDCCEYCPEPKDDEEKELQEKEDDSYVRGRIQFMEEDPGRQSISGSFNPIDDGEWAEQAYMGPTEKLFNAIVTGDRAAVAKIISTDGFDIDRRDHVGRTPLQIAILSKANDIACDLIDAGARMTARVVDGRTALHLAAQLDLPTVVRKLLERSAINKEKAEEEAAAKKEGEKKKQEDKMDVDDDEEGENDDEGGDDDNEDGDRDSSEDDWSSDDDEKTKAKDSKSKPDISQIPEDEEDEPDVFDVNIPDWDYAFTPLQYAVIFGSLGAIDELLAAGADATLVTKLDNYWAKPFHPLTLTALTRDANIVDEVVKKLVAAGATSSQADDNLFTIFHKIVCVDRPELVEALLRNDPNAKAVIESPFMSGHAQMTLPIASAIVNHNPSMVAVLLAYGAKIAVTEEDFSRARELRKNAWLGPDFRWQGLINWPLELAAARCNDLAELLLMLGADVNDGIAAALRFNIEGRHRQTILDAVRAIVAQGKKDLAEMEKAQNQNQSDGEKEKFQTLATMDGWKGALGKRMLKFLEDEGAKPNDNSPTRLLLRARRPADTEKHLQRSIAYFVQLEEDLLVRGAKTWKELHPDQESTPDNFYRSGFYNYYGGLNSNALVFTKLTGTWSAVTVPTHQIALYEELFEACCTGDNAKIEELCLPRKGKDGQELIQITARFGDGWGVSPLSLALEHRHWATARLVLAIATAQYKPKDAKAPKFTVTRVKLDDDDSDAGSDEDDSMDEGEDEINFIDVAQRPSEVQVDVPPERLLSGTHRYQHPRTKVHVDCWLLQGAIIQDDFEAFVQIADLYKAFHKPLDLPAAALSWATAYDRPTILDEVIRRTGGGIDVPEESQDEDEPTDRAKSKTQSLKAYLGLNVHGKKRKDLAQKVDPNAPHTAEKHEFPLAWTAAHDGAMECVRYLASDRALAAYRYYASTHSDDRAKYLRRIDGQIAQRLGWCVDELNESVITAAVIGDKLELLKAVIDIRPAQLQDALMARIHYVGFNHILVAANWGCAPEMFDYLLSKGVSPTDTDVRGWNVYHILAAHNSTPHLKLLDHIITKLPMDVSARMLVQQSKKALNTPLHIAIKKSGLKAVQLLLKVKSPIFLLRTQDGSTPLHIATRNSLAAIARLVGDAGPEEAFRMEDGVGNTPVEIATLNWLQNATGSGFGGTLPAMQLFDEGMLHSYQNSDPLLVSLDEAKELKDTIDRLVANGRLRKGTKLATDLSAFADKKEAEAKKRAESDVPEEASSRPEEDDAEYKKGIFDSADAVETMEYIAGVAGTRSGARQLIHLIDVHRSVQGSLDRSVYKPPTDGSNDYRNRDEEGLEPERVEDSQEKAKKHSAVSWWHSSHNAFELFGEDRF